MNMPVNICRIVASWVVIIAGCSQLTGPGLGPRTETPLYRGMGDHHRTVTTSSPQAQAYFDQGLIWSYAFNHDEAIRSFKQAARLDPDCAMAWWGIALCNGPHINNPVVPPERAKAAWEALQEAMARKPHASEVEQELIDALSHRYADPQPEDRSALDQAYADAMARVWQNHPDDSDIGTLYAEAMMDLHPWDLWDKQGNAKPGTDKILATLETVMDMDPDNPGANHLYIHAIEASPEPGRANASAQRLRSLVPASGHLVHMPSHIDVLTGRWELAARQNEQAIAADIAYQKRSPKQEFYRVYMIHNHHMLAFACMMQGRGDAAIEAARHVVDSVPEEQQRNMSALVDPFMGAVYDAMKRFGRWDEILAEPAPPEYLPITKAMWRFSRALAYAAKGEHENAAQEQAAFRKQAASLPDDAIMAINPAKDIMQIADHMLAGEMAYQQGDIDESVRELRKAIAIEDNLLYMEPPEWVQPVRHTLGAVLVDAGRFSEAEAVYRNDLKKWPNNGWSLYGLSKCLHARGAGDEAQTIDARFEKAWARADTKIGASCLCVK